MRAALLVLFGFAASASAQLAWDMREITLKPLAGDASAMAKFAFKNGGTYPVAIRSTRSSCGCIVIGGESAKKYAPGESGVLAVQFQIGERVGLQEKFITVDTDDPSYPTTVLTLKVNIPALVEIDPPALIWKQNEPAEPKRVKITPNPAVPVKILGVQSSDPGVTTTRDPNRADGALSLLVTPGDTSKLGFRLITVNTDYPSGKPRSFYIYVRVEPATAPR